MKTITLQNPKQANKNKILNIEKKAVALQIKLDKLHNEWWQEKQKLESQGIKIDYEFRDILA